MFSHSFSKATSSEVLPELSIHNHQRNSRLVVMRASDYGTTRFQQTIRRVSFRSDALQNICHQPSMHNAAFGLKASHKELITRSSFLRSTMDVRPLHASLAYHRQCTLVHSQRSSRTRRYRASHFVRSGLEQAVGSDFILIERIDGVALEERWLDTFKEDIGAVIREMLFLDLGLHQRPFSQNGSLFFKKSVSPELQSWLYARERDSEEPAAGRYRIGPVVDKQYWFNEPDHAWTDMASYIQVTCRLALGRAQSLPSDFAELCQLLQQCISMAPHINLPERGLTVPYLIHPDLLRSNVIVKPSEAANVISYIDWQHAVSLPYFQNTRLPQRLFFVREHWSLCLTNPSLYRKFLQTFRQNSRDWLTLSGDSPADSETCQSVVAKASFAFAGRVSPARGPIHFSP
ncbi:uncharacterized protein EV420DRAFT_1641108 [Desarmillaria tabescens]|uniref:Altered inheritance of mitochondria protein 9, mitochondrial n=1 Tax=Armillaria tabescens TaxID=1929756 RepID=A0AA39N7Q0_ARMTA|nr:uncharacterized protein EV420DRAFT_1641108 [Desarmillaria tabescens]KAK0460561.1 hypothetical protein EV420DRAFT_1641108 [Desarmillaria tabescens]